RFLLDHLDDLFGNHFVLDHLDLFGGHFLLDYLEVVGRLGRADAGVAEQLVNDPLGPLVLDDEGDRADLDAVAGADDFAVGDGFVVEEGAVDALQVLDGDVAVLLAEHAVPAADLLGGDAEAGVLAAADDRLVVVEGVGFRLAPFRFYDQADFHGGTSQGRG